MDGSAEESVSPQAEMFAQLHSVVGGDFPFAAQDHGAERKRLAQDAGQIGSHKAVLFEQVLEEIEGTELRRLDAFPSHSTSARVNRTGGLPDVSPVPYHSALALPFSTVTPRNPPCLLKNSWYSGIFPGSPP